MVGLVMSSLIGIAGAVAPNEEWNKTYGGMSNDLVWSMQQTLDSGYVLAGETTSFGAGSSDGWLIKTDSFGNEQWNKTFGGTISDYVYFVQQTSDSGYILAGATTSYRDRSGDGWLIKTDSFGNEQWNKTFGGIGDLEALSSVQQTSEGGYILVGTKLLYGTINEYNAWLIKTDASGNELWSKIFGGIYSDGAKSVQQTSEGGYIIAGSTKSYGAGNEDAWLIKTDANGNEQWNKTFGGIYYDAAKSVQQTLDGGYILAGYNYPSGIIGYNAWLVKTDVNGNEQWNKTIGGRNADYASSVRQISNGGYIIAGYTAFFDASKYDAWLIKIDSSGNEQWNKTFGGINIDQAYFAQQTSDGGYVLAGYTASYGAGAGNSDIWLIKVSSDADVPPPILISTGLAFPLEGYTPYTAPVSSIMDHSMTKILTKDGIVRAFDGEEGKVSYGCFDYSTKSICTEKNYRNKKYQVVGYKKADGTDFQLPLNYKDPYLYYDGHPGYDYPQVKGTDIFAPANGTLCIIINNNKKDGELWRSSTNCSYLSVAQQTLASWIGFHAFYIIHEGLEMNGTIGDYITVFIHNDNLSESVYNEIKTNGYVKVSKNQHIAEVGGYGTNGPNTFGPHIHLEVFKRNGNLWDRVDPYGDGINDILWEAGKVPST
ncbi:MAG: hypothetical protein Q8N37_00170 [bacterium]|nr:hypothetical protein [bacterium]